MASRYRPITMTVPSASDSGMLRLGSFTSPAVNVMLFQASAEKSEPVCDTQMADEQTERGDGRQRRARCRPAPRGVQKLPKLSRDGRWRSSRAASPSRSARPARRSSPS